MKILAIEKELQSVDWSKATEVLSKEAESVYLLMCKDYLREIYFTEDKNAVLILECQSKSEAKQLLSKLPLVEKGIVDFELMVLKPYTGFSRLMDLKNS